MRHTMVTYAVKPGREDENAALVRAVFDELAETQPGGFRYAVFHIPETRQFVHLYTDEGSESGVQALAAFAAFVQGAADRHEQPAAVTKPELIGDYRTFHDPDDPAAASGSVSPTGSSVGESGGVQNEMEGRL
jgi:hypothetical protein